MAESRKEILVLDEEEEEDVGKNGNSFTNAESTTTSTTLFVPPVTTPLVIDPPVIPLRVKTETSSFVMQQRVVDTCCLCFQTCRLADDEFRLHLLTHLETYQGKAFCPVCRVHCTSYEKMVDHFLMVHGKLPKLVCSFAQCIRSFRTQRTLDMHYRKHLCS